MRKSKTCISIALTLIVLIAFGCAQPATPHTPVLLRLSGSTSMQPLLHDLATAYSAQHSYVSFDISAVGSTAGIEALRRGNADLALVARELLQEEEYDISTGKRILAYTVIAQDGIAIVVNKDNPLQELTLYQIRDVFEGQITDWEELGSSAGSIVVISREPGSGTRTMFEELVMHRHRVTSTALIMPGSKAMRDYVATHTEAIGYLSIGYLGPDVAALAIDNIPLEQQTIEQGIYPLTRPFLLVSRAEPAPEITNFMLFTRSPAGQAIVRQTYRGAKAATRR